MANEDEHSPVARAGEGSNIDPVPAGVSVADAARAPSPSPWLGRIIDDRYRVVELLAEGGMGTVFIAEHLKLRKMVALKTIHPSFLGNKEVAARFAREAMASAQLEHPHVASAMDYGSLPDGGAYLVLELVHGPSLHTQIEKQGAAPWHQVCEIGAQIADALSAAHAMGIVHRDLKPENVLLEARHDGPPIVKVLDFGIARVGNHDKTAAEEVQTGRALTQVGAVMGTPGYMAPEQAVGGAVDERADLYALGVILWEMLTGRRLFDAPNLTSILAQQFASVASTRLAQENLSVPAELSALFDVLLAPQAKDRMHSAAELRDLLRSLVSRDVSETARGYRVAVPTQLRSAAPKLRTVLQTVLTKASPRLRSFLAKAGQRLARLNEGASPQLREWALRARSYVDGLPPKLLWASFAAAVVVVTSVVMAAVIERDEAHPPRTAAPRVEYPAVKVSAPAAQQVAPSAEHEVQSRIDVLSTSRSRRERVAAARWLQRPPVQVDIPPFAEALARLELSADCRVQTASVRRLRTLGDPRSLPAVKYWYSSTPRSGCGLLKNRDCYACIRDELRVTHRALSPDGARAPSSASTR